MSKLAQPWLVLGSPVCRAPALSSGTKVRRLQAVRKLHTHLRAAKEAAVERALPQVREIVMAPHARTVDEELDEAAEVITALISERILPGCVL